VILNDAGVGRDRAGIGGLALLDTIGMSAATLSHRSARIGDGDDGCGQQQANAPGQHRATSIPGERTHVPVTTARI